MPCWTAPRNWSPVCWRVGTSVRVAIALEFLHQTGGVEKRTSMLARHLMAGGDEVHIVTRRWDPDLLEGAHFHKAPVHSLFRALKPILFARRAARVARRLAPDILHSQTRMLDFDVVTLGVGCHRAYLEYTRGKAEKLSLFDRVTLMLEERMVRPSAKRMIIANSHMTVQHLECYYGVRPEQTRVVYNGVDMGQLPSETHRQECREELGIPSGALVVLYVGTGFARKGLPVLVEAASALPDDLRRRTVFLAAGSGNTHNLLARLAECPSLDFRFMGKVEGIERLFAAADVFTLPTLYDPFANSTLEALALGVPVITTRMNGVSEILQEGESALFTQPGDAGSLKGCLEKLLQDEPLRRRLAQNGREAVRALTWDKMTRETRQVYEEVLSVRKGRG